MRTTISSVDYKLPKDLTTLNYKRRNLFEWFVSLFMSSHVCQICKRKDIWSVDSWLQIDDNNHRGKDGCSVVCNKCEEANPSLFNK